MEQNIGKERPLILMESDGRGLHLQKPCQDRIILETEDDAASTARPGTIVRKKGLLEKITAYVDAHLAEKITLKDVAAYCSVSISTVTQLFQKKTETTFHNYLTLRRMAAATKLIRADIPLEEIGKQVGYRDHSSFYRAFRQTYGVSPREYKKQLHRQEVTSL